MNRYIQMAALKQGSTMSLVLHKPVAVEAQLLSSDDLFGSNLACLWIRLFDPAKR